MTCPRLLKLTDVNNLTGLKPTAVYADAKVGLFTPPVKKSRSSFWPEYEVAAINEARIAGKSDDEIRQLVKKLVAARTQQSAA